MSPIDLVLSQVPDAWPAGRNRWRCQGICHGGANKSALSIGESDQGAVLLKCWSGCDVDTIVAALGLQIEDLFPPKDSHGGRPARRRLISASQALDVLVDEAHLLVLCASDLAHGKPLDEATRDRLTQAAARVIMIRDEVHA